MTDPVLPVWAPTPDRVASILRARTRGKASRDAATSGEQGEWNDLTRPTLSEVEHLIAVATEGVVSLAGTRGVCNAKVQATGATLAAYRTAQLIEISYYPETASEKDSAFGALETLAASLERSFLAQVTSECPLPGSTAPQTSVGSPVGRTPLGPLIGRRTLW